MTSAKRRPKAEREAQQKARYLKAVDAAERAGDLDPRTYREGCGRCGGDLVVHPYPVPCRGADFEVKTLNLCPVCRVDRVKRWADLNGIARDRGLPHGGLDVETMTHVPIARALAKAGLIQYDREDGAWELTQAGLDALRELDGENRRFAIAEWEARRARFEEEHAEWRRKIDERFPEVSE